jgi:hypothetical protein
MEKSRNVLVVECISIIPKQGERLMSYESTLEVNIKHHCSITNNHFMTTTIISDGWGYSQTESLKECVQNFFKGNSYFKTKIFDRPAYSFATNEIHSIDIQLTDPLKSLFVQLFDVGNWKSDTYALSITTQK